VVAYDESTGAMAAARLWWLLRWAGHEAVAVLDGGFALWRAGGLPCSSGDEQRPPPPVSGRYRPDMVAVAGAGLAPLGCGRGGLGDARAAGRFRGEDEDIGPVAGHIPGARPLPYAGNLGENGGFISREGLRQRLAAIAGAAAPGDTIFYCGSGVTAAHDVLAY